MATSQNKEKFEDYDGFVEKFKPKKTTDDCYTPQIVYEAVADWVANEYDLDKSQTSALVSAYTQNISMQKDYYFAVCRYNVEFAGLVAKMGLSIQKYNSYFK